MKHIKLSLLLMFSFLCSFAQLSKKETNGIDNRLDPALIGTIINRGAWNSTDLTNTLVNNGLSAMSISGDGVLMTPTTAGTASQTANIIGFGGGQSVLEYVRIYIKFTINQAPGSTTYGPAIGFYSVNSHATISNYAQYYCGTGASEGKLFLEGTYPGATILQTSSDSSLPHNGDSVAMTIERTGSHFHSTVVNLSNGSTKQITADYDFSTSSGANPEIFNSSKAAIFLIGGSYTLDSLNWSSAEMINPWLACGIDSKTVGYAGPYYTSIPKQLKQNFPSTATIAGSGDRMSDALSDTNSIFKINPKYYLLDGGSNDPDTNTFKTNYALFVNTLQSHGIVVFHHCLLHTLTVTSNYLTTAAGALWRWNWINANYPQSNIIDDYHIGITGGFVAADSVHPTAAYDSAAYAIIISSGKIPGGRNIIINSTTSGSSSPTLDNVLTAGNSSVIAPNITGFKTTGPAITFGDMNIQPYASNNAFWMHNLVVNGTSKYVTTGNGEILQQTAGQTYIGNAPSGTAGSSATVIYGFKTDYTGGVGLGGNVQGVSAGTYTGSLMSLTNNSWSVSNMILPSTGAITDSFLTITSSGAVKVLLQSGAVNQIPVWNSTGLNGFAGLTYVMGNESFQVSSTGSGSSRGIVDDQNSTDANGASLFLRKSRGTLGSPTVVVSSDFLGAIQPQGYDGSSYITPGLVGFVANGTIATNSIPTDFLIQTGVTGNGTERMRITSGGKIQFKGLPTSVGTPNIKVQLSDSSEGQITPAALATLIGASGGTTIYTGDGTVNNRTLSLTGFGLKLSGLLNAVPGDVFEIHGVDSSIRQATPANALTLLGIAAAQFTPTPTNTTNVTSATIQQASYIKIGNTVQVNIGGTVNTSIAATISSITFTLPFSTATTSQSYVGQGTVSVNAGAVGYVPGVVYIVSGSTCQLFFVSGSLAASEVYNLQFTYKL